MYPCLLHLFTLCFCLFVLLFFFLATIHPCQAITQGANKGFQMTDAIRTYQFIRSQQQIRPVDACTDAAHFHGVKVSELAAALIALNIDTARLSLI